MPDELSRGLSPVFDDASMVPDDDRAEDDGFALCLSGGGYRAMLFHLGFIIRLNEMGKLQSLERVSSVSGGSITAATLGLAWKRLNFLEDTGIADNLEQLVVEPVRAMGRVTVDKGSIIGGLLRPGRSISQNVARKYDEHLFHEATLAALPTDDEGPRFVINATNVQTGKLLRFSRPYMGDYTIGLWRNPTTRLSDAVTASSAFPPVLSPHAIAPSGTWDPTTAGDNNDAVFRKKLWLSDGGVYDNLGLETAWKRYRSILVSDGGGQLDTDTSPKRNWAQHGIRVAAIVDGQVRALRKRQLIDAFERKYREGSYWSMRSDIEDYGLADPIDWRPTGTPHPADVPTRLKALDDETQRRIINWGYVVADTALRRWVFADQPRPSDLPLAG